MLRICCCYKSCSVTSRKLLKDGSVFFLTQPNHSLNKLFNSLYIFLVWIWELALSQRTLVSSSGGQSFKTSIWLLDFIMATGVFLRLLVYFICGFWYILSVHKQWKIYVYMYSSEAFCFMCVHIFFLKFIYSLHERARQHMREAPSTRPPHTVIPFL